LSGRKLLRRNGEARSRRFSRSILHAIAVLGVKPKPLRGRLATARTEYILERRALAGEA
jgi:hypothetical protein